MDDDARLMIALQSNNNKKSVRCASWPDVMGQVRHGYQYHIGDFPGAELSRNGNGTVSAGPGRAGPGLSFDMGGSRSLK